MFPVTRAFAGALVPHATNLSAHRTALFDALTRSASSFAKNISAKEIEEFKQHLEARKEALGHAMHDGDTEKRKTIIGRYYDAYNKIADSIEEGKIKENFTCFDDKIKIYRVKSLEEKALGSAIIAKDIEMEMTVGRMFIAHGPDHDHLSILSVKDVVKGSSQMALTLKMLDTYLNVDVSPEESSQLKTRKLHRSCIGFYSPYFLRLINYQNERFSNSAPFSMGEIYDLSSKQFRDEETPETNTTPKESKAAFEQKGVYHSNH